MDELAGFKRLHRAPKRVLRGGTIAALTPRGRWLLEQSKARYLRRPDAFGLEAQIMTGELGTIENFRFILTP